MVSESKSTGVVLPWEQAAIKGQEIPKGLDYPDQILFILLRDLYARFRDGKVDKETATAQKQSFLDDYRVYAFHWESGQRWVEIIRKTDLARAEYRKNRTLENADKLVSAIDGIEFRSEPE